MKHYVLLAFVLAGLVVPRGVAQNKHFTDPFSLFETGTHAVQKTDKYFENMRATLAAIWDLEPDSDRKNIRDRDMYKGKFGEDPSKVKLSNYLPQFKTYVTQCTADEAAAKIALTEVQTKCKDVQDKVQAELVQAEDKYRTDMKACKDEQAAAQTAAEEKYKRLEESCGQSNTAYKNLAAIVNIETSITTSLTDAIEVLRKAEKDEDKLADNVHEAYVAYVKALYLSRREGKALGFNFLPEYPLIDIVVGGQLAGFGVDLEKLKKDTLEAVQKENPEALAHELALTAEALSKKIEATK